MTRKNLNSLIDIPGQWIDRIRQPPFPHRLILALDDSVSETYGHPQR